MIGFSSLSLLLGFFIAIDTSDVYPPEVRETFVENSLAGETFTQQLPANTAAVFMTGNLGVCKSKRGIVIPLSEAVGFAEGLVKNTGRLENAEERLETVDMVHDISRSVLRMFHGEVGVALLNFPVGRRSPDFIVRADIDESEMAFTDLVKKVAGALGVGPAMFFPHEEDGYLNFANKVYVRIKDKKLYASSSRLVIEQFLSGAWKGDPLSQSALYREAGKKVEFDQEQFLFVNVERIWEEFIAADEPMPGELKTIASSLFGNIRAIASSTRLSRGNLNILSAVLFKDLTKGIPKVLARPNARSETATFVPPDYSLLVRAHTGPPVGLLRDIMALHEEVARGMQQAFPRIEQQLGFSVERELLPGLAGDFAVAAKMPPMVGIPESLVIVSIADHDKAAFAIESIIEKAELAGFDEEYEGTELHVLPLPLVSLTYVFVEGHLLVGSSPGVVKAAIDARLSGRNLAASDLYRSALEGHPSESFATMYADSQTMFDGLLNIGGGLVRWRGGREGRKIIVPLIALLRKNVKGLTPVSCSIYREGNAIILRTNSRLFAAGPAPILLPSLILVRRTEVKREVIRQRDEAIRRKDKMMHRDEMMRKKQEMMRQGVPEEN